MLEFIDLVELEVIVAPELAAVPFTVIYIVGGTT